MSEKKDEIKKLEHIKGCRDEKGAQETHSSNKLEECQKLQEEYLAGWKRARADFLNYKKREEERLSELRNYVKEDLILKILPILDNIYMAESQMSENLENNQWLEGLLQIKKQILDFFKSEGIEKIEAKGQKFDPNFHEVIDETEAEGKEPGIIIEEIKKGYISNNKVLRPARVKISK